MKKILWPTLLLLVMVLPGLRTPSTDGEKATYHFGIRLYPQNGYLVTTALITVHDGKVVRQEIVSHEQFVKMMSGIYSSKANPESKDILLDNGILTCHSAVDSINERFVTVRCPLFEDLWKVRYKFDIRKRNYFYSQGNQKEGWAGSDFFPSKTQYDYLIKTYGADGCNSFIWGDSLIKFLKDVSDSSWRVKYKEML